MSKDKKKKKGGGAGFIAFGVTFVLLSSVFKIHGFISLLAILGVSSFVSAIIRTMAEGLDLTTQDQKKKMAQEQTEAAKEEEKNRIEALERLKADTGNPDVDQLLTQGREIIKSIRRENDLIPDESLSEKLDQLENLCGAIFQAVYENPAKAPQIRKFMEYYLPTTLKIVRSYRLLDERNLPMTEARDAQQRIDDALGVVVTGCQKMLQKLYKNDMLDITTDLDVLEQMLKRDGLTESELEKAAEQAKQAARLDAALNEQLYRQRQAAAQTQTTSAPQRDQGVKQAVDQAQRHAMQHTPQAPTLSGGMYPAYDGQAAAEAPRKE